MGLNYKIVIPILFILINFNIQGTAADYLSSDIVSYGTVRSEGGAFFLLWIPESLNTSRGISSLGGSRLGTLWEEERRLLAFENIIRELCTQRLIVERGNEPVLGDVLGQINLTLAELDAVMTGVESAAKGINKQYVNGRAIQGILKNKIALLGRSANIVRKHPNFAVVGMALADLQATTVLVDVVYTQCLYQALATEHAARRLSEIRSLKLFASDPVWEKALDRAEANLILMKDEDFWKGFVVAINDKRADIATGAISIGAALTGHPIAWAFAAEAGVIAEIANQEHMVQEAAVAAMFFKESKAAAKGMSTSYEIARIQDYSQAIFYHLMSQAFSTSLAIFKDFLTPGRPQGDWSDYYRELENKVLNEIEAGMAIDSRNKKNDLGQAQGLDVALIIDSSGSMKQNDPNDLRKQASSFFADMFSSNDRITIVDFDNTARVYTDGVTDKAEIRAAIERIDSDGGTNVGAGLKAAFNALSTRENGARKGALLLTDGIGDYAGEADLFRMQGWPVYTIGLMGQTNEELLNKIAVETGGLYFKARDSAALQRLFGLISNRFVNQVLVSFTKGIVKSGQTIKHTFEVDRSIVNLMVSLFWPGSDLDLTIKDPTGKIYTPSIREKTYEFSEIKNPLSGRWDLEVKGVAVSPEGEPYDVSVSADTPVRLEEKGLDRNYRPGETLSIEVKVAANREMAGQMTVVDPNGLTTKVPGKILSDSIIFETAETTVTGDYDVEYTVTGISDHGERVARTGMRTIRFSGEPYEPDLGRVTRVEGAYITVDFGQRSGIRPGIRVSIFDALSSQTAIAEGFITEVRNNACIVELQVVRTTEPKQGFFVRFNMEDWKADKK